MIRRLYRLFAAFASVHVVALIALAVALVVSGSVDMGRVRKALWVLRGFELPSPARAAAASPTEALPPQPVESDSTSADTMPVRTPEDLEVLRRESERIGKELEQRLALTNSMLLRVTSAREELERDRAKMQKDRDLASKRTSLAARDTEGFRRQVEIFDGLNPKVAMEHLLGLEDPTEAALLLSSVDTRKANKIIESAKSTEQQKKMQDVLQRIRDVTPDRPAETSGESGS